MILILITAQHMYYYYSRAELNYMLLEVDHKWPIDR